MEIKSFRSLDRSVQFFVIKGRFLIPMGAGGRGGGGGGGGGGA